MFLVDYPLLPADMDNLLLYTGIMISFDLEKMGRTRGEPQKMSILGIQRPDLRSAEIYGYTGWNRLGP